MYGYDIGLKMNRLLVLSLDIVVTVIAVVVVECQTKVTTSLVENHFASLTKKKNEHQNLQAL